MKEYKKQYKEKEVIGRGNFGSATLVERVDTKDQFIAKKIILSSLNPKQQDSALQEAQLLRDLHHKNVVSYVDSFKEGDLLVIIMEYCQHGDLGFHIKRKQQKKELFPEMLIVNWFYELALAVKYIHEKKILHRDIKTTNIFLTNDGTIKIGDFGISKVLENTTSVAKTVVGTPYYMSPEVCESKPYTYRSDIWALGCVLFELCALTHAFESNNLLGLIYKIVKQDIPDIPQIYSKELNELVHKMLNKNEHERPNIHEVISDQNTQILFGQYLQARPDTGQTRTSPNKELENNPKKTIQSAHKHEEDIHSNYEGLVVDQHDEVQIKLEAQEQDNNDIETHQDQEKEEEYYYQDDDQKQNMLNSMKKGNKLEHSIKHKQVGVHMQKQQQQIDERQLPLGQINKTVPQSPAIKQEMNSNQKQHLSQLRNIKSARPVLEECQSVNDQILRVKEDISLPTSTKSSNNGDNIHNYNNNSKQLAKQLTNKKIPIDGNYVDSQGISTPKVVKEGQIIGNNGVQYQQQQQQLNVQVLKANNINSSNISDNNGLNHVDYSKLTPKEIAQLKKEEKNRKKQAELVEFMKLQAKNSQISRERYIHNLYGEQFLKNQSSTKEEEENVSKRHTPNVALEPLSSIKASQQLDVYQRQRSEQQSRMSPRREESRNYSEYQSTENSDISPQLIHMNSLGNFFQYEKQPRTSEKPIQNSQTNQGNDERPISGMKGKYLHPLKSQFSKPCDEDDTNRGGRYQDNGYDYDNRKINSANQYQYEDQEQEQVQRNQLQGEYSHKKSNKNNDVPSEDVEKSAGPKQKTIKQGIKVKQEVEQEQEEEEYYQHEDFEDYLSEDEENNHKNSNTNTISKQKDVQIDKGVHIVRKCVTQQSSRANIQRKQQEDIQQNQGISKKIASAGSRHAEIYKEQIKQKKYQDMQIKESSVQQEQASSKLHGLKEKCKQNLGSNFERVYGIIKKSVDQNLANQKMQQLLVEVVGKAKINDCFEVEMLIYQEEQQAKQQEL